MARNKNANKGKALKINVGDLVKVEDCLVQLRIIEKKVEKDLKVLLTVIGIMILASFISSFFVHGIIAFIVSLIFGAIGFYLGLHAIKETRKIREFR